MNRRNNQEDISRYERRNQKNLNRYNRTEKLGR